jgi:RNA polymerase sigma factor (sigma-70 family)
MNTTQLRQLTLGRVGGESSAELIDATYDSFRRLARNMLRGFSRVRSIHETDDVWHDAAIRMLKALREITPTTQLHFCRLAGLQIRRTLIDMARECQRQIPTVNDIDADQLPDVSDELGRCGTSPLTMSEWAEFHGCVDSLPEDDRIVFDLLWYTGLTQQAAADLLHVDLRTIQRRWRSARLSLSDSSCNSDSL